MGTSAAARVGTAEDVKGTSESLALACTDAPVMQVGGLTFPNGSTIWRMGRDPQPPAG